MCTTYVFYNLIYNLKLRRQIIYGKLTRTNRILNLRLREIEILRNDIKEGACVCMNNLAIKRNNFDAFSLAR
jgi:hypothetical protein